VAFLGDHPLAAHLAARTGGPRLGLGDWRGLRAHRVEVGHAVGDLGALGRAAWTLTLGGVLGAVATPVGDPGPLPWWNRRYLRFLFRSQPEARAWLPWLPLGRLVVVEADPGEAAALDAVYREVASMGRRPGRGDRGTRP